MLYVDNAWKPSPRSPTGDIDDRELPMLGAGGQQWCTQDDLRNNGVSDGASGGSPSNNLPDGGLVEKSCCGSVRSGLPHPLDKRWAYLDVEISLCLNNIPQAALVPYKGLTTLHVTTPWRSQREARQATSPPAHRYGGWSIK
jgi:hypothetical protein